jgi:hypothetical protein
MEPRAEGLKTLFLAWNFGDGLFGYQILASWSKSRIVKSGRRASTRPNEEERMRIAVIGTGGIGGPYGASLARAGADVIFVARGAHLAAICENGLRIEGDRGETHIRPAQATDDIASIGIVDYVLLCVKLWDVETAGEQIRPIADRRRPVAERHRRG